MHNHRLSELPVGFHRVAVCYMYSIRPSVSSDPQATLVFIINTVWQTARSGRHGKIDSSSSLLEAYS
jgi:hypothetical protein